MALKRESTTRRSIITEGPGDAACHGATGPSGSFGMRTERPTPWGFDVWDPRLTLRQQAADAQRNPIADTPDDHEPAIPDEPTASEQRELEVVGAPRS